MDERNPPHDHAIPKRRSAVRYWVGGLAVAGALIGTLALRSGEAPAPSTTPPQLQSLQELAATAESTPARTDPAPDFSVPTLDGSGFSLSDHVSNDGRPVILNLWASWCFPCRAEMPTLDAFQDAHPEVTVVGVAVQDDQVAAEDFAEEIGVDYIIGFDEKDVVNAEYAPLGLPATFWISADGQIVKRLFGTVTEDSLEEDVALFAD